MLSALALSLFFFKVSIICSHFYSPIVISMVGGLMTVECFWSISMYCMVFISGTEPFILANNLQQLFARIVVKTWERESCTVASMEKEGKNWIFTTMFWPITTPLGAFPPYQASNQSIWNIYLFYNAYIQVQSKLHSTTYT